MRILVLSLAAILCAQYNEPARAETNASQLACSTAAVDSFLSDEAKPGSRGKLSDIVVRDFVNDERQEPFLMPPASGDTPQSVAAIHGSRAVVWAMGPLLTDLDDRHMTQVLSCTPRGIKAEVHITRPGAIAPNIRRNLGWVPIVNLSLFVRNPKVVLEIEWFIEATEGGSVLTYNASKVIHVLTGDKKSTPEVNGR